jgi:TonB family protein
MRSVLFAILLVGVSAGFTSPASGQQAGMPMRIGGTISPPTKTKDFAPVYPPEAQQARISGVVILEATVGEDGKVRSARVLRSIPLLDQAAINAVQQWEYTPTLLNGVAVPIIMTVTVNFTLQGAPGVPQPLPLLPNTVRLLTGRGLNGQTLVWDIDVTEARRLPRWNTDVEPAISTSEAVRLARSWIAGRNPQKESLILQGANLTRRALPPLTPDAEVWFYLITYSRGPVLSGQNPPLSVIVLLDGSVMAPKEVPASAVQSPAPPSVPVRYGDASPPLPPGVTTPRLIQEAKPSYTAEAMRRKIVGTVLIQGVVTVDGAFRNLQVVRSLDAVYGLDNEALKAAGQYRFTPGMRDGQPVPVAISVEIAFTLR